MQGIKARVLGYLESLRFPWLLLITVLLFLLNAHPGRLALVDEIWRWLLRHWGG
jgi:hypothetical protein